LGRALYSVTKDTDVQLNAFLDYIWNDTKFFSPDLKSLVFPVAGFFTLYDFEKRNMRDCYELFHFKHQMKYAMESKPPMFRVKTLEKEIVKNTSLFFKEHMGKKKIAWDLETSGFGMFVDDILCITISFDGKKGYLLKWPEVDAKEWNEFLKGKYQIGANLKFDCRFMWARGVTNAMPSFDTLHAGHCLNEMRSNSLKTHAWVYTNYGGYDLPLEKFKRKFKATKSYSHIPDDILVEYATMDAIVTYQTYEAQEKHLLEDPLLHEYFYTHVMPTVRMFVELETAGVFINWDNIRTHTATLREKQNNVAKEIYHSFGKKVDLTSYTKLGNALEKIAKLPCLGRAKSGDYLSNEDVLQEWSKQGYKIADLLLEYRGYTSLLNTFLGDEEKGSAYWEYRQPDDKIYPTYAVMMAKSHRNKAHSPNMQQVPHHGDKAWMIRSFFMPPDKRLFYIRV
jgi:DNA polymerase I-like protein with 3'-5' exonuclease and polymerase domains